MRLVYAHLCDYAIIEASGKPSYLGIFSLVNVRSLPAHHLRSFVAFGVELPANHSVQAFESTVRITAPSGEPVAEVQVKTSINNVAGRTSAAALSHTALALPVLLFKELGPHRVEITLAKEPRSSIASIFDVAQLADGE